MSESQGIWEFRLSCLLCQYHHEAYDTGNRNRTQKNLRSAGHIILKAVEWEGWEGIKQVQTHQSSNSAFCCWISSQLFHGYTGLELIKKETAILSFSCFSDRHCASNTQEAEAPLYPPNIPITSSAMLPWLFPYSQFILTEAASALPSLHTFLQIIPFWRYTISLWPDQVCSQHIPAPTLAAGSMAWLSMARGRHEAGEWDKTQALWHERTIAPRDRSLPTPCYPSGQCLHEIWDESKKLPYTNSHHISNSLDCYTEKNVDNSLSCHLFATLLHAVFAVWSFFLGLVLLPTFITVL